MRGCGKRRSNFRRQHHQCKTPKWMTRMLQQSYDLLMDGANTRSHGVLCYIRSFPRLFLCDIFEWNICPLSDSRNSDRKSKIFIDDCFFIFDHERNPGSSQHYGNHPEILTIERRLLRRVEKCWWNIWLEGAWLCCSDGSVWVYFTMRSEWSRNRFLCFVLFALWWIPRYNSIIEFKSSSDCN